MAEPERPVEIVEEIQEILEVVDGPRRPAPPPPPPAAARGAPLPAAGAQGLREAPGEFGAAQKSPLRPPPPAAACADVPSPAPGDEALEGSAGPRPPPPPAVARRPASGDAASDEVPAEERAGREFWDFVDDALGRKPDAAALLSLRSFPAERPAERARLVRFARQLAGRFPSVPQARALASLSLLHAAAQEKERGLLTGVNRERLELIREGLGLLDAGPAAAGHVSVLFEHDGRATRAAFAATVELLADYLAFCHSSALDPRAADSAARFTSLP